MRILIAAATAMEVAPLVARLEQSSSRDPRITEYLLASRLIDVLITGVGMVATAAWCARALAQARYDCAINVGLCGSFDRTVLPGAVVHVISDRLVELGAEDDEAFLSVGELGLLGSDDRDELVNAAPLPSPMLASLPAVRGITVNTVHGSERSIAAITARFKPQIETMEGAAFMYACAMSDVPFAQIRGVSNVIERRNRAAWRMEEAIDNVGAAAFGVLETL